MKQLDLNLLRVFIVLLEKRNTRIAAESLALSQPAVSKALGRLRDYFDDELFTRIHSGLEPTPRALDLGRQLPQILDSLESVIVGNPAFDPMEYRGQITIAINGFISNWMGASLCEAFTSEAPYAQVNIVNWDSHTLQKLLDGEIQGAINYSPIETNKQFTHKVIGKDDYVGLVRKGHPKGGTTLTQKEVNETSYASLVVPGWNEGQAYAAKYLTESSDELKIQVRSSYLHMLLELLKSSELVMPCSLYLAHYLSHEFDYVHFPTSAPDVLRDILLVESHNKRMHPMHQWVTDKIVRTTSQLMQTKK